jgi:hypothetical protein
VVVSDFFFLQFLLMISKSIVDCVPNDSMCQLRN